MLQIPTWPIDAFDQFWELYPRRVGKKAALREFEKIQRRNEVPFEVLISAVKIYARSRIGKEMQYVAHPSTWLHQGRWDDEPDALLNIRIESPKLISDVPAALTEQPVAKPNDAELDEQFRRLGLAHLRVK